MSNKLRKTAGTTLIEILVVIVVFTVGILAVVQIFPKGFQILTLSRASTMATFMSRDQVEKLTAHPDTLPDGIVPIAADTGLPDPSYVSTNLGLNAIGIDQYGNATLGNGVTTGPDGKLINWASVTGFNNVRGIIGESQPIPSPSLVGSDSTLYYGGVVTLQFGPTQVFFDNSGFPTNLTVYGNDLTRENGAPSSTVAHSDTQFNFEYLLNSNPTADVMHVYLPTGPESYGRVYLVSYSGYLAQPSGPPLKRSFSQRVLILPGAIDASGTYAPQAISLNAGPFVGTGDVVTSIDLNTLRVERIFRMIPTTSVFNANDPFQVKVLNATLGTLLFSPAAYNYYFTPSSRPRVALRAKIDYTVRDWRILREDFRVDDGAPTTHQLPIQSLRTNSQPNADGTPTVGGSNGFGFENLGSDQNGVDHFVLMDLRTGGTYVEQNLIQVDKSRGLITFLDADASRDGIQGTVLLPDGTTKEVDLAGRPVRALYQARYEWAVQVLKSASSYAVTASTPTVGQFYVGGSGAIGGDVHRIYFPPCDTGRKVTVGQLWYFDPGDTSPRSVQSQDFKIKPADAVGDTTKLPYIDIRDVDGNATSFDQTTYGYAARDIKGSSLVVRTIWNPNSFSLSNNSAANVRNQVTWGQSWRHSTSETFLDQGVTSR